MSGRDRRAPRCSFAPTVAILKRLREGERSDIVILTREGLEELVGECAVVAASKIDLARSWVGIAVKAGQPHPDISTEAALRATLLAARSVAYSKIGASGIYFAGLIQKMGIASEINARATITAGFTAERLNTGEADLAVQQLSELKQVAGNEGVGSDPARITDTGGFHCRPHGFVAKGGASRCDPEISRLVGSRAGVARVRP